MRRNGGVMAVAFVKWVVIPVGLAAIGFFLVGPKVANSFLGKVDTDTKPTIVEPAEAKHSKSIGEPKIEVTAQRVKQNSHRRSKPKPPVAPEQSAPVSDPPPEESPEPPTPEPDGGASSDGTN